MFDKLAANGPVLVVEPDNEIPAHLSNDKRPTFSTPNRSHRTVDDNRNRPAGQ
jgi:poly(3-hydroxybutyrate) depolymerase